MTEPAAKPGEGAPSRRGSSTGQLHRRRLQPYVSLMVHIGAIVLKVSDTARAAQFWSRALGYQPGANPDFLLPSEAGGPRLHLDETDQTHLDLWAADDEEQRAEIARLEALGAT